MSRSVPRESRLISRVDRARANPAKLGGVHYTPLELADFIARRAWSALHEPRHVRVLDPACGDGALLSAVVASAPAGTFLEVVGLDTDAASVRAARRGLADNRDSPCVEIFQADFLDWIQPQVPKGATLPLGAAARTAAGSFDLVIANPPYVRTQVLGAKRARELAQTFGISGRIDLYHAFLFGMSLCLRKGGVLGLLCSNRFLTTQTGRVLRQHLAEAYELQHIYDLGDTRLFAAAVLPAVVIAQRSAEGSHSCTFTSVYELRGAEPRDAQRVEYGSIVRALPTTSNVVAVVDGRSYNVSRGTITRLQDCRSPWVLPVGSALETIEANTYGRFGDLGKIRVGIKTTADAVFIRDDWDAIEWACRPEAELLLPLVTHHAAERWQAGDISRRVLYPYDLSRPSRTPIDLGDWPRAAAYLERHRKRLESRHYVVAGGREWWEIWVPHRPSAWSGPRIVFPDISEEPKFFIDLSGAIVNGDCYWIPFVDKQIDLAYLMIGVGNSTLATYFYDAACGNRLYAGRRRYITQYVAQFPLPDPGSPTAHKIRDAVAQLCRAKLMTLETVELERQLDSLVWQSFGFEEPIGQRDL